MTACPVPFLTIEAKDRGGRGATCPDIIGRKRTQNVTDATTCAKDCHLDEGCRPL
ncbi:MAG: hypothetical protein ACI81R_000430 [Bradymonadia bacterium]|jgi:hypothetical protein